MATKTQKLGPGVLRFGETASAQEFASQVTTVTLEPDFDAEDPVPVLDGGEVPGDVTETYQLTGEFLQEFSMESLLVWCKANSGQVLPFVFTPNTDSGFSVTGSVQIRATAIGGDVRTSNTAEFEFPGVGDYSINENAS